jgi:hypothetical protein
MTELTAEASAPSRLSLAHCLPSVGIRRCWWFFMVRVDNKISQQTFRACTDLDGDIPCILHSNRNAAGTHAFNLYEPNVCLSKACSMTSQPC